MVGDKDRWRKRGGVAAALLDAAEHDSAHSPGRNDDALLKRLYQTLSHQPGVSVTLGENVHGHPADALVRDVDGNALTTVLLDRGSEENADSARHLRLMLHRRSLLSSADGTAEATRWPAWKLYDTVEQRW